MAASTAFRSASCKASSRDFRRDLSAAMIWSAIALRNSPPTMTCASPGYSLPVLLVTGTTTTRAR